MTPEEYDRAARYWTSRDAVGTRLPREDALARIDAFLSTHTTCALATGNGTFVRCTPLEYAWHDGRIWILSEGGLKFRGLAHNAHVCLAVFDPYTTMGQTHGLQVTGTADIVGEDDPHYARELAGKGLTVERLHRMGARLHLLRITPQSYDLLDSDLRGEGVDARQHVDV